MKGIFKLSNKRKILIFVFLIMIFLVFIITFTIKSSSSHKDINVAQSEELNTTNETTNTDLESTNKIAKLVTESSTTYYSRLQEAIDAASITGKSTITLLKNTNENVVNTKNLKNTIIDLNGNILAGSFANNNSDATITLKNGRITSSDNHAITNAGNMTITSGIYTCVSSNANHYAVNNTKTLIVTGGIIQNISNTANIKTLVSSNDLIMTGGDVKLLGGDYSSVAIYIDGGKASISGVDVNSTKGSGITANRANVTINDTTISAKGLAGVMNRNGSSMKIYDSTIKSDSTYSACNEENSAEKLTLYDTTIKAPVLGKGCNNLLRYTTEDNKVNWKVYGATVTKCKTYSIDYNNPSEEVEIATGSDIGGSYASCQIKSFPGNYITEFYNNTTKLFSQTVDYINYSTKSSDISDSKVLKRALINGNNQLWKDVGYNLLENKIINYYPKHGEYTEYHYDSIDYSTIQLSNFIGAVFGTVYLYVDSLENLVDVRNSSFPNTKWVKIYVTTDNIKTLKYGYDLTNITDTIEVDDIKYYGTWIPYLEDSTFVSIS